MLLVLPRIFQTAALKIPIAILTNKLTSIANYHLRCRLGRKTNINQKNKYLKNIYLKKQQIIFRALFSGLFNANETAGRITNIIKKKHHNNWSKNHKSVRSVELKMRWVKKNQRKKKVNHNRRWCLHSHLVCWSLCKERKRIMETTTSILYAYNIYIENKQQIHASNTYNKPIYGQTIKIIKNSDEKRNIGPIKQFMFLTHAVNRSHS